ncbi:MAG: hypothetical protein DPW18_17150 [Chloroflexi bacterium]|nr:hypothetical protein [Chloroflexota bacterium]MDL1941703.1 hypothetical protein [Chloroflexi bacterium CFX2]
MAADGNPRLCVHIVQSGLIRCGGRVEFCSRAHFYPVCAAMARDDLGNYASSRRVEADENWCAPAHCQHVVDRVVRSVLEMTMDEMKYELLTELTSRLEADLLESYLEASGIDVELFQESVGHNIYPVTIDMLGRVQVFVPKEKMKKARKLLEKFNP